ncbi:MAG: 2-amino-4-hydroxy-6-hydroxymethyldihydropteridine diphosphokinase [Legionellales bacterium]|nr:2-amino-4-hydroxy-6-hydroxymethyldihydropteridine diphosphokinase [Legionellales bacterium]
MRSVYVALGSNLNQPWLRLVEAVQWIRAHPQIQWVSASKVYHNVAMGPVQPDYLNAVCHLKVEMQPMQLLDLFKSYEQRAGRMLEGPRWNARPLDLDLIWWEGCILNSTQLTLPHSGCWDRLFVLKPWQQVCYHDQSLSQRVSASIAIQTNQPVLDDGYFLSGELVGP